MNWRDVLRKYLDEHKRLTDELPRYPVQWIDDTNKISEQQVKEFLDEIRSITIERTKQ